jgi:hypothetical protein
MSTQLDSTTMRQEAAQAGERLYEQKLKRLLEPTHNGQVVAIHIPSGEHFLGDSILEAADRLRAKYPNATRGEVYARGVGERAVIHAHTPRITRTPR